MSDFQVVDDPLFVFKKYEEEQKAKLRVHEFNDLIWESKYEEKIYYHLGEWESH